MATKKTTRAAMPICSGPSKADQARWQAEDDLRTMQRMGEIKSSPQRVRQVEKLIQQQAKAVQQIKRK